MSTQDSQLQKTKTETEELNEAEVDPQIFKDGLHCIGKTFNNARHAFLSLAIPDNNLTTLRGIERFKYLQNIDVSGNSLTSLRELSSIKHLIKLNASNNLLRFTFDFQPPANLEWVDYSGNKISRISGAEGNLYLKYLYLDNNQIAKIDGLSNNKQLRVLSLNGNGIDRIENLEGLWIEELFISANSLTRIESLHTLPVLRTLDLSKNQISRLRGLEQVESLKFLNMSLNNIQKINQLRYIENLPLLTEVDFCVNPVQNCKYYRLQCLFHIPQLRMLDGVEIISDEKVKAENLHGYDLQDREIIFKSLLPEEKFIDRRIGRIEDVQPESESDDGSGGGDLRQEHSRVLSGSDGYVATSVAESHKTDKEAIKKADTMARQYVGELISHVDFKWDKGTNSPRFIQE